MEEKKNNIIKIFLIKIIAITFSIIIIINVTYNLILADKLESLNKLLKFNDRENVEYVKNKIRAEISKSINKEKILNEDDKILIFKLYKKIQSEFKDIEK